MVDNHNELPEISVDTNGIRPFSELMYQPRVVARIAIFRDFVFSVICEVAPLPVEGRVLLSRQQLLDDPAMHVG